MSTDRRAACALSISLALYRVVPYYRSATVSWRKKGPTPRIKTHFRGSKPLQILTKLRQMIVYTIVTCTFKRKSSAARFALKLTAETQGSSAKVHNGQTGGPIRAGGTPTESSAFIPLAEVWDDSFQMRGVRLLRNSLTLCLQPQRKNRTTCGRWSSLQRSGVFCWYF